MISGERVGLDAPFLSRQAALPRGEARRPGARRDATRDANCRSRQQLEQFQRDRLLVKQRVEASGGLVGHPHNPSVVGSSPTRPTLIRPFTCFFAAAVSHTSAGYGLS